jgi:hypothetical protein
MCRMDMPVSIGGMERMGVRYDVCGGEKLNCELIGLSIDQVIIPPPTDEKTAAARKTGGDMVCEDWWFCHKKLKD